MSVEASAWAWRQHISSGAKMVLLALADHADRQGYCWPGADGLAEKCDLTRSTIWRHLQLLEAATLITRTRRSSHDGRKSNAYQLNMATSQIQTDDTDDALVQRPENGVSNVSKTNPSVPTATSQDRTGTVITEPSLEPSGYIQQPLDPSVWPDWYADLQSIPGFKKDWGECQAWLDTKGITADRADQTAAAIKGQWPGARRQYKDAWAVFRNWVQRDAQGHNGSRPSRATNPNAVAAGWGDGSGKPR